MLEMSWSTALRCWSSCAFMVSAFSWLLLRRFRASFASSSSLFSTASCARLYQSSCGQPSPLNLLLRRGMQPSALSMQTLSPPMHASTMDAWKKISLWVLSHPYPQPGSYRGKCLKSAVKSLLNKVVQSVSRWALPLFSVPVGTSPQSASVRPSPAGQIPSALRLSSCELKPKEQPP